MTGWMADGQNYIQTDGQKEWRTTKIQYSPTFSKLGYEKGHNSVKSMQMTSKFELDLYFMML